MRQVQCGVDLVEEVHWCWLELEQGEDEREGDQGALAAGELGEGLFPDLA